MIKPVSSLSIKRAVNLYTIILFLSFTALLYWLATDRYQVFIDSHENTARTTSKIVTFQISKILSEKQRELDIFAEDSRPLLNKLTQDPDNNTIKQQVVSRLKKHQPDFLEFNILSTSGKVIAGNLNSENADSCLQDFNRYIKNDSHQIRLHPDNDNYHYDIISRFSENNSALYLLARFNLDEITNLLNSIQSQKHHLVLINKDATNPIGVTSQGEIKEIDGGLNFKIHNGVKLSTIAKTKVRGTSWYVADMSNADLFSNYRNKILKEYFIVFYIFAMIVFFMRYILLKQDTKRSLAEEQLKMNNEQIVILNNSLDQLSKRDGLTNLYNRRYFDDMLKHEWNRGLRSKETLSCILLDIDYFKNYNDFYGHQAGDKCLKDISALLKDSFRRSGDIVARYGGEEFIIAMSDCSEEESKVAIAKFQQALNELKIPHQASETQEFVTASAGLVSEIPSQDSSIENFIRKTDKALYQAKANGRNQFVVYNESIIDEEKISPSITSTAILSEQDLLKNY